MAVFIDPKSGERYENVPDDQAERARDLYGLVPESEYVAGSVPNQIRTGFEELGRKVVSGGAALARGIEGAAVSPEAQAQLAAETGLPVPPEAVGTPTTVTGKDLAPGLFTPEALERREVNPTAVMLGSAAPVALGAVLAPATGGVSLGAALGLDALDGAAQEALDSDLEGRAFDPANALRNGGMNGLFSVGGVALGGAAKFGLSRARPILQDGIEAISARLGAREAAPVMKLEQTLAKVETDLSKLKRPPVENNRASQRDAIEAVQDVFARSNPTFAQGLEAALGGSGATRRKALTALLDTVEGQEREALQSVLNAKNLWGSRIVDHDAALAALSKGAPSLEAPPAELASYADSLRSAGLTKRADTIDEIARQRALDPIRRPRRSVGAAGETETMTIGEAEDFLGKKSEVVDSLRALAGGTSREARGAAQEFSDTFREVVNNAVKHRDFAKFESSLSEEGRAALQTKVRELAESARPVVEALETVQSPAAFKVRAFIEKASKEPSAVTLDQLKNALQSLRAKAAKASSSDIRSAGLVEVVDGIEPALRAALENADIVGPKLAELQKVRNALWSNPETGFIRAQRKLKAAGFDIWDVVEHDYDGRIVLQTDQRALKNLIDADPQVARPALDALEDLFESSKAMAQSAVEVGASSAERAPIMKMVEASEGMLDFVKGVRKLHGAEQVVSGYKTGTADMIGRVVGEVGAHGIGAAIGGSIGGTPGAIAGGLGGRVLLRPLTKVATTAARAARGISKEGVSESLHTGVARRRVRQMLGIGGVAGAGTLGAVGTADAAEAIQNDAEAEQFATARALVHPEEARPLEQVPPASARFQDTDPNMYEAFERHRAQLETFGRDPEKLADAVDEMLGGLPPRARAKAAGQAFQIVNFLKEKMPGRRGASVARPKGTPPSPLELRTYALYATAALDPASVLADARQGRLRREQVETLQRLWPSEYDGLRNAVVIQLGQGSTTATRQRMNLLFGFGDAIDPALGPKVQAQVKAARESKSQPDLGTSTNAPGISSASLPSQQADVPAGQASLQLLR